MSRHDEHAAEPPIRHVYDLSDLSEAGDEVVVEARAEDLEHLAEWLDIQAVERFRGVVTLSRKGPNRYRYDAVLEADLIQACVVSLDPVKSHHEHRFSRILHVKPRPSRHRAPEPEGGELSLAAGDDEVPEELDSFRYDLAGPLLEELVMGIDPYPRAQGVEFELPAEHRHEEESPFAALKRLKREV